MSDEIERLRAENAALRQEAEDAKRWGETQEYIKSSIVDILQVPDHVDVLRYTARVVTEAKAWRTIPWGAIDRLANDKSGPMGWYNDMRALREWCAPYLPGGDVSFLAMVHADVNGVLDSAEALLALIERGMATNRRLEAYIDKKEDMDLLLRKAPIQAMRYFFNLDSYPGEFTSETKAQWMHAILQWLEDVRQVENGMPPIHTNLRDDVE